MQKLEGHWVAKRIGIIDHYKGMTLPEIVLFDAYLLLSNKQTWECWRTIRQMQEILPMKKDSIVRAKRSLREKGWIVEVNRTGVFIPKLYRYVGEDSSEGDVVSQDRDGLSHSGEPLSRLGEQTSGDDKKGLSRLGEQTFPQMRQLSRSGEQFVSFGGTIIEEDDIIEDDNILSRSNGGDEPLPEDASLQSDGKDKVLMVERPYLKLLKSIPGYPFNFEKDLPFIRDLLVDFPSLNLAMEIRDWKTWLMDKRLTGRINYRSRLRRWVKNSIRYKEKDNERHPIQGRKPNDKGVRPGRKGFDLPSRYPVDSGGDDDGKDQGKGEGDRPDQA